MPNAADITVKKADGTTDIVYDSVLPSSGSANSPAIWRSPVGAAPAFKAELKCKAYGGSDGNVRYIEYLYTYPVTAVATDGSEKVVHRMRFDGKWTVPQQIASTTISEAVRQGLNLMAAELSKLQAEEGFAAT